MDSDLNAILSSLSTLLFLEFNKAEIRLDERMFTLQARGDGMGGSERVHRLHVERAKR